MQKIPINGLRRLKPLGSLQGIFLQKIAKIFIFGAKPHRLIGPSGGSGSFRSYRVKDLPMI
jgi:hypothetical protein